MSLDAKEASAAFWSDFKHQKDAIQDVLASTPLVPKTNLPDHFEAVLTRINDLQKRLTDALVYLPPYDERQFTLQLKGLSDELNNQRAEFTPKQKFSFKSRKAAKDSAATATASKESSLAPLSATPAYTPTPTVPSLSTNCHTFTNLHHRIITLPPLPPTASQDPETTDCSLSSLTDCLVLLLDPSRVLGAIHVRDLRRCVVTIGPISGSVLIHDCNECVFVLGCHQFRMHTSTAMDIYLHVTSHPIIEDCTDIRFGPYTIQHPDLDGMFKAANLSPTPNHYATVEDFNWLKKQASPNWRMLAEEEIRTVWPVGERAPLVDVGNDEEARVQELIERYGRKMATAGTE